MVKKGLTEFDGQNGMVGSKGSSVKGILFFLFALAVCFGYFYFFTDILRSKEETPGQPDVFTSEVKKPLPERLVQSSATSGEEAVTPPPVASSLPATSPSGNAAKDSAVSPGKESPEQKTVKALPEPVKPSAAPPPTAKTQSTVVGKNEKANKVPAAQLPATQKTAPAKPVLGSTAAKKNSANLSHSETKIATSSEVAKAGEHRIPKTGGETHKIVAGHKPDVVKIAKIPAITAKPKKKELIEQAGTTKVGGQYTLVVGTYVLKSSMRSDKEKLEKSGLQTSVLPAKIRNEPMNRLLVAEVATDAAAQEKLAKVKKASKDAFFLRENNKYAIYAGSYFAHDRAVQEQERLRKLGFAPIMKMSQAPVSTYSLAAGSYPTREAALKGAERLKKLGFKPYPVELTK
jgi:hypothetical protein